VVIAEETYKNIASYLKNSSLSWKYGWDQASNLLFIDQIRRTGFSYTSDERDIHHNEHGISDDLYDFVHVILLTHSTLICFS
ncbi:serine carboxypeptidase-like protein, partial [Tanacetum coccineum]